MDVENFEYTLNELKDAATISKKDKALKLSAQLDFFCRRPDGIHFIYQKISEIVEAGFFDNTPWANPDKLVPALVRGTLKSGHPASTSELVSELRILAVIEGKLSNPDFKPADAQQFIEEVIVLNLEFAFKEPSEETRVQMSQQELEKCFHLFDFILDKVRLDGIKDKLAEEIFLICAQRPIVTKKSRDMIRMIRDKVELKPGRKSDDQLRFFVEALYSPSKTAAQYSEPADYAAFIEICDKQFLQKEAESHAHYMRETGLCNPWHAALLIKIIKDIPDLLPVCLCLNGRGAAEWEKHQKVATDLILENLSVHNYFSIYGFARLLEKNLFSRSALKAALNNLRNVKIDPQSAERILKSIANPHPSVNPKQYLISATLQVLGQPLGVGQGNNATCQSARGISMWSQHSPSRLINMIITVATQNNLVMRFENDDLESIKLGKGLVDELDFNLDAVSALLVPHLDRIYNEMMKRAGFRGEDPHKWVNPAMYGSWIQVGFKSVYDYASNMIVDFQGFVRTFFASFHPEFNGNNQMIYPNPVGIFVTSSRGDMVGFHAVSLLRINDYGDEKEPRAYFLNPNNEGRQDWGQGIKPSVSGHGEKRGESSLPVSSFAARLYAFHYNHLQLEDYLKNVPDEIINRVEKQARESWGRSYQWLQIPAYDLNGGEGK